MEVNDSPRVLSGRYELRHLVARGGMADVYRAQDRLLDRPVALKILFPELSVDRSFVERFRREAQAAANLSSSNIVPVFDWGEDGSTYFIVMEYIDGHPLSAMLRGAGPLQPERAAEIAADVAAALSYAHRHGVIHRDVKPGNVLITDEGAVKVTDFGIARAVNTEESLTQTGAVMGTATYFSPEQAEGRHVDARSDLYSLGVVLFEMVTGRPPFMADSPVAVASKHVRETPPTPREVNPAVPPTLEAIILTCLAKSPDARYPTADALRSDLLRFTSGRAVQAGVGAAAATRALGADASTTRAMAAFSGTQSLPVVPGPPPDDEDGSHTGLWVALLLVLLVALGVVVFFLGRTLGWWESTAARSVVVPPVAGETVRQATTALEHDGLKVDARGAGGSAVVTSTTPGADRSVAKGTTVLLFTRSPAPVVHKVSVPGEVNQSLSSAKANLRAIGLVPSVQTQSSCTQVNLVCSQSPGAGTSLAKGSTVVLYTAPPPTTPADVPIPDVSGQSVTAACSQLGHDGFNCSSTVQQQASYTVASGDVVATQPASGTPEPAGTTVVLVVSTGPDVPNVTGDTASQAEKTLSADGYSPQPDATCSVPTAIVDSQSPSAGTSEPSGTAVAITCAPASSGSSSSSSGSSSSSSSSGSGSSSSGGGLLSSAQRGPGTGSPPPSAQSRPAPSSQAPGSAGGSPS